MAIPIQTPTLAELLAAYQNNGVANGISQASTNFNTTARTAAEIQAQRAGAATAQQQANTAEQERLSHIVSPEDLNAGLNGQPINHPVNQTFADTIVKAKQAAELKDSQLKAQAFEAEQNRLNRESIASQAAQVHKDAMASTAQTARSGQFEAAGKNLAGLHWYDKVFNTDANKAIKGGYNFAAGQVGAPSLNGVPAGMISITASDGSNHYIPQKNLDAARKLDPNLKVNQ